MKVQVFLSKIIHCINYISLVMPMQQKEMWLMNWTSCYTYTIAFTCFCTSASAPSASATPAPATSAFASVTKLARPFVLHEHITSRVR